MQYFLHGQAMNVLSSTDEGVVNTSLLQRLIRDVGSMVMVEHYSSPFVRRVGGRWWVVDLMRTRRGCSKLSSITSIRRDFLKGVTEICLVFQESRTHATVEKMVTMTVKAGARIEGF